jgi:hypothetical protein
MKYKKVLWGVVALVSVINVGAFVGNSMRRDPVQINYPPVGDLSSYEITMYPNGSYSITYRGHDPTVLNSDTYVDTSNGVFGIGGRTTTTRSGQFVPGRSNEGVDVNGKKIVKSEECIKAAGGGESTGAIVGASVATGFAPMLTGIPYVGWLASGWLVMFGQDVGSQIGGEITTTVKGC